MAANAILNVKRKNPDTGKMEWVKIPAIQGESAYDVAVKNGFTGTEQEWLDSLRTDVFDYIVLKSSTIGSNKKFKVTIDDSGVVSVKEFL